MEFLILGPLEVREQGRSLPLGGAKQRALLAILLINANRVVPTDRLIDLLWGDEPPAGASKTAQVYVSQLRKALDVDTPGRQVIITRSPGYLIDVPRGELDLHRFADLVDEGRRALESGSSDVAAKKLRDALAVWRGPALADFAYESFAQMEIARLEEARLSAVELRMEAELACGRHAHIIGELESLTAQHPLRERPRAQLMLALYRSDRQADALKVYRDTRQVLSDEIGIEPGPALRNLEKAILSQDETLGIERPGVRRLPPSSIALVVKGGPFEGRRVDIDMELIIGREAADVTIEDPEISRGHAIIRPISDGLEITDLGSRNGTWVNGERIDSTHHLRSGDVLRLGRTSFEVVPGRGTTTITGELMERKSLLIKTGPSGGRRIEIDRELVVGREGVDIAIDDPEISRRHAIVRPVGSKLEIKDLGSSNGTWVNGKRITPSATLETGDVVRVGQTELEVTADRSGLTITR